MKKGILRWTTRVITEQLSKPRSLESSGSAAIMTQLMWLWLSPVSLHSEIEPFHFVLMGGMGWTRRPEDELLLCWLLMATHFSLLVGLYTGERAREELCICGSLQFWLYIVLGFIFLFLFVNCFFVSCKLYLYYLLLSFFVYIIIYGFFVYFLPRGYFFNT